MIDRLGTDLVKHSLCAMRTVRAAVQVSHFCISSMISLHWRRPSDGHHILLYFLVVSFASFSSAVRTTIGASGARILNEADPPRVADLSLKRLKRTRHNLTSQDRNPRMQNKCCVRGYRD